jgi:hypothetical protein
MVTHSTQKNNRSLGDRAWRAVVSDWEHVKGSTIDPRSLTKSDLSQLSRFKDLDALVKAGVSKLKSAREALFSFRALFKIEAGLDREARPREKKTDRSHLQRPLLHQLKKIFEGVSFNVSNVRKSYNDIIPDKMKDIVDAFGGKTFKRDSKTPNLLMLASVPKEKENKDLSIKTLMNGVDSFVEKLEEAKKKYPEKFKHEFKVMRSEHHLVLYRVINGVEQSIEMSFRRANKVDIFIDGNDKPSGSLYNDDALKTAEAFLRGKNMNYRKRSEQPHYTDYVVVKDIAQLRSA